MAYTYDTMPKSTAEVTGMRTIKSDFSNILARTEKTDLVYSRKNGQNLHIRLVYPDQHLVNKTYPLLVHIQGSAWFKQNLSGHVFDFKDIVTDGYILAVVEYLPIPDGQFPSQVEDAKKAVRYLAEHAEELSIDLQNVFLSGDSSGGHTALMCWATWNKSVLDTSTDPLPELRGMIDLYGITDLTTIADFASSVLHDQPASPENILVGDFLSLNDEEKALRASVRTYLNRDDTYSPLLIMHGNRDTVVPFEQSVELQRICLSLDIDSTFYCIDDADHGGSLFYSDEVIQTMIDFLHQHHV